MFHTVYSYHCSTHYRYFNLLQFPSFRFLHKTPSLEIRSDRPVLIAMLQKGKCCCHGGPGYVEEATSCLLLSVSLIGPTIFISGRRKYYLGGWAAQGTPTWAWPCPFLSKGCCGGRYTLVLYMWWQRSTRWAH